MANLDSNGVTPLHKILALAAVSLLAACTNPYDPAQRAVGGALLGAGSGAAIGGAVGGGHGAAVGAAIGGVTGLFGGVATTPPSPPGTYYGYPAPVTVNPPYATYAPRPSPYRSYEYGYQPYSAPMQLHPPQYGY